MSAKKATNKSPKKKSNRVAAAKVPSESPAVEETPVEMASGPASDFSANEPTQPETERHRDSVASLALQIVSAQLTARSQYDMLSAIWADVRKGLVSIAACVVGARSEGINSQESSAGIRNELDRIIGGIPKPRFLEPIGFQELRPLLQSAMHCAEKLLIPHENDDEIIFAEQLFEVDEVLSENGISKRFMAFGWTDLTARPSVIRLLGKIDGWFAEWFNDSSTDSMDAEHQRLSDDVAGLVRAKQICDAMNAEYPEGVMPYRKELQALERLIRDKRRFHVDRIPKSQIKFMDLDLVAFIYYGMTPELRLSGRSEYGLRLMSVAESGDLASEGRSLVIIALVGDKLHIRVFDPEGIKVVDKPEAELVSGPKLAALKKLLNNAPFPDESALPQKKREKMISSATSIAGYVARAPTRFYRPWGLFRYLRLYGKDGTANSLNGKLKIERNVLSPGRFPEAQYPDLYEMLALEQLMPGWRE